MGKIVSLDIHFKNASMCGRYSFALSAKQLQEALGRLELEDEPEVNYNIAPTQQAYVVTNEEPGRLQLFCWGLLPYWSKENRPDGRLINARREGIEAKPSFRLPFQRRRCWVLADSFYEWEKRGKERIPFRILLKKQPVMVMAGIWDVHGHGAEAISTFSIITTAANSELMPLHDRMPALLLGEEQRRGWLEETDPAALQQLLDPPPDNILEIYRVSTQVNNFRNNGPQLHQAFGE